MKKKINRSKLFIGKITTKLRPLPFLISLRFLEKIEYSISLQISFFLFLIVLDIICFNIEKLGMYSYPHVFNTKQFLF